MKIKKYLGWLIAIFGALAFMNIYENVYYSVYQDEYTFILGYGAWSTPSDALHTVLWIGALVVFVRVAVSVGQRLVPSVFTWGSMVKVNNGIKLSIQAIVLTILYWWTTPIIIWMAKGTGPGGIDIFNSSVWLARWRFFDREEFLAFIPASLAIVGFEMLRRWIVKDPFSTPAIDTPDPVGPNGEPLERVTTLDRVREFFTPTSWARW